MRTVLFLVLLAVLCGCNPKTVIEVVDKREMVITTIPEQYTSIPAVEAPPSEQSYVDMGKDEREDALTRLVLKLYSQVQVLISDRTGLKEYIDKQKERIDAFNASEDARIKALKESKGAK